MRKTTLSLSIPIIIVITLFANSCTKKVTPVPTYNFTDEFKSYCLFQPGSSWDYYKSDLEDTVTVNVDELIDYVWYNNVDEIYYYEAYNMVFSSNSLGYKVLEITAGSTKDAINPMNSLMRIFFDNGDYRLVFDAKYPLGEEQIVGQQEGVYENVEILPSMKLHGNSYSDVYHTRVTDFYNQGFGDFDFYIAKNHGLIKMRNIVNNDTIVTELINSNPIQ
ncbi:MAG: hypothetical protein C0595_11410 [Marinilabiliales bacterium]|nr:MAG: hypothetical protein C0595_11410 [Marinilabiliales bacterium]